MALDASALQGAPPAGFDVGHLRPLQPAERLELVNQASVGFSNPCGGGRKGGLMIVGTEHAYDPIRALHSLAVEGIALSAMWHADATAADAAVIAGQPDWVHVAAGFQRDPGAFYGPRAAGHTWSKAAICLLGRNDPARLFASAYFFELSAHRGVCADRPTTGRSAPSGFKHEIMFFTAPVSGDIELSLYNASNFSAGNPASISAVFGSAKSQFGRPASGRTGNARRGHGCRKAAVTAA